MRIAKILIALGSALLLASCEPVQSIHPLYTDANLAFEPALLGTWVEEGGSKVLIFQESGEEAYRVIYFRDPVEYGFEAHLVRLGDLLFLDFLPDFEEPFERMKATEPVMPFYPMFPAHIFIRVKMKADVLEVAFLDDE